MELNTKYSLVSSHSHHPHPGLFTGLLKFLILKFLIFFSEVQAVRVYGWKHFTFFYAMSYHGNLQKLMRSQKKIAEVNQKSEENCRV